METYTEIENAKITRVSISMSDHACLTFWIHLEGRGWGCGFGGYAIAHGYLDADKDFFSAENGHGLVAMMRIMNVVGVSKWEDLEGKYIRCKTKHPGSQGIDEIGNIIKDRWFNIREFFAEKSGK